MKENAVSTIDEYMIQFPIEIQTILTELRAFITELVPEATQKISYQMPTFYLYGNLVHFAAHKNHIGFYPAPSAIEAFQEELSKYKWAKGSVQFPLKEPMPYELIKKMVLFRVEENTNKHNAKQNQKKKM